MKKILFTIFIGMLTFMSMASNKVEGTTTLDNWMLGVNVGAVAPQRHAFDWANHGFQAYRPEAGITVGKWLTPVVGLSVSDEVLINTTPSHTAIDVNTLMADVRFNLSNFLFGYKGKPRTVEFEVIPSIGWLHNFGQPNVIDETAELNCHEWVNYWENINSEYVGSTNSDYVAYRAALQIDFNLGKNKAWQINVTPAYNCYSRFRDNLSSFDIRLGLTYKMRGHTTKSHNFVLEELGVPQDKYDALVAENTDLKNTISSFKPDTVEIVKVIDKTEFIHQDEIDIIFDINETELTPTEKNKLDKIENTATVIVEGFASPSGKTSTNKKLATERAANVTNYLLSRNINVENKGGVSTQGATIVKVFIK